MISALENGHTIRVKTSRDKKRHQSHKYLDVGLRRDHLLAEGERLHPLVGVVAWEVIYVTLGEKRNGS